MLQISLKAPPSTRCALTVFAESPLTPVRLISRQHARVLDLGGFARSDSLSHALLVQDGDHKQAEDVAAHHRSEDAQRAPQAGDVPRCVARVVQHWTWLSAGSWVLLNGPARVLTDDGPNGVETVEHREDGTLLGLPAGIGDHPRDNERVRAPHETEAVVTPKRELLVLLGLSVGVVKKRHADHHGCHHAQQHYTLLLESRGEVRSQQDGDGLEGPERRVEQSGFLAVSAALPSRSALTSLEKPNPRMSVGPNWS